MLKNFKLVKKLVKKFLSAMGLDYDANRCWSQEGEDKILSRIFESQRTGFYIDVGAHHPRRFSNTYFFYRRGWRGINIDAMPGSMRLFKKDRGRDINIEAGVGRLEGRLDYYMFNEPALNGFSKEVSLQRHSNGSNYKIEKIIPIDVLPLSVILNDHLPKGQGIDFMTVDVEGLDMDVLRSNDWIKYRPKIVLVEVLGSSMHEIQDGVVGRFMVEVGYVIYAKCVNTVFFKKVEPS